MSEIIWQSVLDQLKATMPRSAFDTWVADTHFVSSNDTLFLVGCRNAGSRDWLESRVQTTIEHLLAGMMNRSATVSFVVSGDPGWTQTRLPMACSRMTTGLFLWARWRRSPGRLAGWNTPPT